MSKPKAIDKQGHEEKQSAVPAFVWCPACGDTRLKSHEWRRPCPPSALGRKNEKFLGG